MTNSYTAGTLTVLLSDRHGNFAQLPGVHAGDAPKGGEVPSNLPDFLHRSKPMPNYGLTPTAALGIFTRGHRRAEQDAAKRKRGKAKPPIWSAPGPRPRRGRRAAENSTRKPSRTSVKAPSSASSTTGSLRSATG